MLQRTGSFKPRGVTYKLSGLSAAERAAGVAAVSGGNHGVALADVAGAMGIAATVVMAESAPERSKAAIRAAGADLRLTPDMAGAFALLDDLVAGGKTLVHPFDDPTVIAGQGTVGLEFATDAPEVTDVLVSIGGGALISGVATAFCALLPGRAGVGRGDRGRRGDVAGPRRGRPGAGRRCPRSPARSAPRTSHSSRSTTSPRWWRTCWWCPTRMPCGGA